LAQPESSDRRIEPLVSLYASLRSEIVSDDRVTDSAIAAIVIIVIGVITVGYGYHRPPAFTAAPPALMILATYWVTHQLKVRYIGRYCAFLEDKINLISGDERLMSWENTYAPGTFRRRLDAVRNPLTPLILLVLLAGLLVFLGIVALGSQALYAPLYAYLNTHHHLTTHYHWAAWIAVLYGSFFLVWPGGVAVEYFRGMRFIDKLGVTLAVEIDGLRVALATDLQRAPPSSAKRSGLAALLFKMIDRWLPES
jgi:hypothetical protein